MSNFLLKDPECIFIHIPKTAGTSIRKGVWKEYEGPVFGHIPKEWSHLFSFAFIRHPLQRLASAYNMFTQGATGDSTWKLPLDARPLSIKDFIDIVTDENIIYDERRKTFEEKIRHHTIPQTDDFNCLKHAKFVGRFENIDRDFSYIVKRLNIKRDLPKIHTTTACQWQDIFKEESLEHAIEYYKEDFKLLEYKY